MVKINTYKYKAYGIGLRSAIPLPPLMESQDDPGDVQVHKDNISLKLPSPEDMDLSWAASPKEVSCWWGGVGTCQIREGREIVVDASCGSDPRLIRQLILGIGLDVAMHQRGRLLLHASVATAGEQAVLFMGDSGGGKSTTLAALVSWGFGYAADDVASLEVASDGSARVFPSWPQIKLCPDAATALGHDPAILDQLHPFEKRLGYRQGVSHLEGPHVPAVIYVLAEGDTEKVENLNPRESFLELIRHTKPIIAELLEPTGTAAVHLQACARLASSVPVRRLSRRMNLASLSRMKTILERDLPETIRVAVHGLARHR